MITVRMLKAILDQFDDNEIVVMACDEEGNRFSPMAPSFTKGYFMEDIGETDFVSQEEIADDADINTQFAVSAICFWPDE